MGDIPQEVRGMIDPVAAMTELKSRLSKEDWRTICDYIEAERELAKGVYEAAGKRAGMERAAEIAEQRAITQRALGKPEDWPEQGWNARQVGIVNALEHIAQAIRSESDGHG